MDEPAASRDGDPGIVALLSRVPLFQALSRPQIERIASATGARQLTKGEILFQQGEESRGFFVVLKGQIKLAFASPQGNEKVLEIIGPRQSFGEAVMFMGRSYPVLAQALSDAALLQIPSLVVFELIATDPTFARAMLAGLSRRLHSLIGDVEAYSLRSGTQRLIGYLLQQHAQQADTDDESTLTLPISKQILASRLNLTPESLSRVLHDLSAANLITVRRSEITVHGWQRLREFDL
jgi:CRP-like cAMP-binding protein